MKKITYLLAAFALLFSCSPGSGNKEVLKDVFGEELDSLSFDELQETIVAAYSQFSAFYAFIDSDDEKPEDYTNKEERHEKPFSLSHPYKKADFKKGVKFFQAFEYPGSVLKIDSEVKERAGESIAYTIDRVYFDDGTSDSANVGILSSRRFDLRIIDSVKITVSYRAVKQMKGLEFPVLKNKAEYKNGLIRLDEARYNFVQYNMTGDISKDLILSQAVGASGKILDRKGYLSGDMTPKQIKEKCKEVFKVLENITKKIQEDKYKTKDGLLSDLVKKMAKVNIPADSEKHYRSEYYYGNVSFIILYFAERYMTEDHTFTAYVHSDVDPYNLVWNEKEARNFIIDERGSVILSSPLKNLKQINGYYYQAVNYYDDMVLHLDVEEARLDTLKPYKSSNIACLTGELVCLTYRNKKGILDKYGHEVAPLVYDRIEMDNTGSLIIASAKNKVGLFDKYGKHLFGGSGYLESFSENMALYRDKHGKPVCFIDKQGKPVLPLARYGDAGFFSDGLAVVEKGGMRGCIRKDGSVAIPFVYDEIKNFSNETTLVKKAGLYGLITINNEFIVPLSKTDAYASEAGGKRTYYMDGDIYDEYGELITENN